MAYKQSIRKLNLATQGEILKRLFPASNLHISYSCLIWTADITPSPLSQIYTIQLRYKLGESPQIHVLKPELVAPEGKRLPHTYPGKRLCLYLPRTGEWRGDMLLSQTIVPWISEWLLHYEIWLVTGKWYGGGIHPNIKREP